MCIRDRIYFDRIFENPETAASAIRIGNPASWNLANAAFKASGGAIEVITDEEIFAAQSWLASKEGLFVEPASAVSVAALLRCGPQTPRASFPAPQIPDDAVIVCTLTGNGLKDTAAVLKDRVKPAFSAPDKAAILSLLEKAK